MTQLSPFHKEMFSFLRRHVDDRAGQIPASLEEAMKEGTALDLDQVVSDVHKILGEGEGALEWRWISSISQNEFNELGLKFPRIYRGLPRLYHRDDPSRSIIRENFRNLSALKKGLIDRAIVSLYEGVKLKGPFQITLLVWVIPDGLGDWIAAVETAEMIRGAIPEANVQILAVTPRAIPKISSIPTQIVHYEKMGTAHAFTEEQVRMLRESDLILQIPTYFPDTKTLLQRVAQLPSLRPAPMIEQIGEYGYLESSWFHPKTENRSMGLHALEKGILIKEIPPCEFSDLESQELLESLFGTKGPSKEEIGKYRSSHRFHLAYLFSPKGGAIYLHSLLKRWEKEGRDIDLCSPDLGWLIGWIEERQGKGLPIILSQLGVREVEIVLRGNRHVLKIGEKGKRVRIFSPAGLVSSDMKKLIFLSDDWVAVRGDQSFSEAVSAGKSFFYDGREHARYFVKDLAALASNRLSFGPTLQIFQAMREAFLWNLPEEKGEWVDETHFQREEKRDWEALALEIGASLQNPKSAIGFKKLSKILREEHSFNPFITALVRRRLFHRINPIIGADEGQLLELFGKGAVSFTALVKNLRDKLLVG